MFTSLRCAWLVLCIGVGIVACSGDNEANTSDGWIAAVDTVGDTIVVRTMSGSVWADTAFLSPEITIGVLEGADEYMIGNPRAVSVSSLGNIFVLDRQVPVVRMYSPDGTFVRNVGREGSGPGEYKSPGAIAVLPDDRLLVRDPGNGRVSIFDSDGEYLEQLWYPGGFNTSRRLYVDRSGYAYSMVLLNYGTSPWDWIFGLARIDPIRGILDTVPAPI